MSDKGCFAGCGSDLLSLQHDLHPPKLLSPSLLQEEYEGMQETDACCQKGSFIVV